MNFGGGNDQPRESFDIFFGGGPPVFLAVMPLVGPAGNQVVDDPLEFVVSSGHGKPPGDDGGLNRSPVKNAPALRASASR